MALPRPPAKELAAIAARGAAANGGRAPSQASVLKTYANNVAKGVYSTPSASKPPGAPLPASRGGRSGPGRGTTAQPSPGGRPAPGRGRPAAATRTAASKLPTPQLRKVEWESRQPGSPGAADVAATREAIGDRLAQLDSKVGVGRAVQGLPQLAKSTPVTAYYALRGAFGPSIGDAMVEAIYGRTVLEELHHASPSLDEGDYIRRMAQGTVRPINARWRDGSWEAYSKGWRPAPVGSGGR